MDTSGTRGLLDLPAEITHLVARELDILDCMRMRMICSILHAVIPPPSVDDLLELERTIFKGESNLYTCGVCLTLRPRGEFADKMVDKKRGKSYSCQDAGKRFCVECGITPNPETGARRYTPGCHVVIFGEQFVVCRSCWKFDLAAVEDGRNTSECPQCRPISRAKEQRAKRTMEENKALVQAERLRVEKKTRRAKRREIMGSEYEDREYSPTESELWFDEVDVYMGSPKAGSD